MKLQIQKIYIQGFFSSFVIPTAIIFCLAGCNGTANINVSVSSTSSGRSPSASASGSPSSSNSDFSSSNCPAVDSPMAYLSSSGDDNTASVGSDCTLSFSSAQSAYDAANDYQQNFGGTVILYVSGGHFGGIGLSNEWNPMVLVQGDGSAASFLGGINGDDMDHQNIFVTGHDVHLGAIMSSGHQICLDGGSIQVAGNVTVSDVTANGGPGSSSDCGGSGGSITIGEGVTVENNVNSSGGDGNPPGSGGTVINNGRVSGAIVTLSGSIIEPPVILPIENWSLSGSNNSNDFIDDRSTILNSISDHHGTASNSDGALAYITEDGRTGISFNANNIINIDRSTGNYGTDDFSVSAWIKTTDASTSQSIVAKRGGQDGMCSHENFWNLNLAGGQPYFEIDEDENGTNYNAAMWPQSLADGHWHLLVGVRSGPTLTLYVDGVFRSTATGAGTANLTNSHMLSIGGRSDCVNTFEWGNYFIGTISDVTLQHTALSSGDVQSLYNGQ